MSGKKDICRFTIQFNPADPCHRKVIELLNSQGRSKAQFISNAITHYIHCTQTPDISDNTPTDIEAMIISAVNRYMENRGENAVPKPDAGIKDTPQKQNDVPFDDNDIQAITDTLSMFRKR